MYWVRRTLVAVVAVVVVAAIAWFVIDRGKGPGVDPAAEDITTTTSSHMTGVLSTKTSTTVGSPSTKAGKNGKDKNTKAATSTGKKATGTAKGKANDQNKKNDTNNKTSKNGKAKNTKGKAKNGKAKNGKAKNSNGKAGTKNTKGTKSTATSTKSAKDKGKNKPTGKTPATKTATTKTATTKTATTKSTAATTTAATTTTPTTTAPPPPSYDDQGRLLCPDSAISVKATTGQPSYPAGAQPILGMTVTNTGAKPCVRDLSGPLQVYTVYSKAGKRMWSTNDCFPGEGSDVRELEPGQGVPYNIKWSGTTSSPGCSTPRTPVKPGDYKLVASLGKLSSPAKPFTITG